VAVVRDGGRVLVRRRPAGSHLAGAFEFPGGKRRKGERGRACAVRETREETGLEIRAGAERARVRHDYPERQVRIRFFEAEVRGGRLRPGAGFRWVAPVDLAAMEIPGANRAVVADLAAGRWPISPSPRGEAGSPPPRPPRGGSSHPR